MGFALALCADGAHLLLERLLQTGGASLAGRRCLAIRVGQRAMGAMVVCPAATALSCRSGADVARAFLGAGISASGCHAAVPQSNAMGRGHAPCRPGRQPATRPVLLLHAVLVPAAGAVGTVGGS